MFSVPSPDDQIPTLRMTEIIEKLTEGQKACLRLYYQRYDAKEIARQLEIAPSTVHQRLTAARKILGVARSMEAARILVEAERTVYDGALYDGIDVDPSPVDPLKPKVSRFPWPWPTVGRPVNDLSFAGKLAAIAALAAAFMVAAALYFVAIRVLSKAI